MNLLPPRQYDQNLLAHGIVRPLALDEDAIQAASDHLARIHAMSNKLPDSILQSAVYGRLMAAALSAVSAGVLALDQAQAALAAGLAIVGAALAVASKVREWLRARQ